MALHYQFIDKVPIAEYDGVVWQYVHRKTGATVVHLKNQDPENLFAFCFKTPPLDSTGLTHILEHTVLCGSKNYPVRDAFQQLLKGSVYSFLNAMTYPDRTIYPAASALPIDLLNLMSVYGDAVFFPLLKPEMFMQEGYSIGTDQKGVPQIGGIVFNEMIGATSTMDHVVGEESFRNLLPNTFYRFSSGGIPENIIDLQYRDFIDYYRRYYHPGNSLIFLYGNIATSTYLRYLHGKILRHYDGGAAEQIDITNIQQRWNKPKIVTKYYPSSSSDDSPLSSVTVSWLLPCIANSDDIIMAEIISELLLGHSGSPLYKKLLDSGYGTDLSAACGVEADLQELMFTAGLQGVSETNLDAIEPLIIKAIKSIVRANFSQEEIAGVLFRIEFSMSETKSLQGLRVLRRIMPGWVYHNDPFATLSVARAIDKLKVKLSQHPQLFEEYITEHILNNPHRLTLIVRADSNLAEKNQRKIRQKLAQKIKDAAAESGNNTLGVGAAVPPNTSGASGAPKTPVSGAEPNASHAHPIDESAVIPKLGMRHLPRTPRNIEFKQSHHKQLQVTTLNRATNNIVYQTVTYNLNNLTYDEIALLPLFCDTLLEIGTPELSPEKLSQNINSLFGGLYCGLKLDIDFTNPSSILKNVTVHAKTLYSKIDRSLELLSSILKHSEFSRSKRIKQLLNENIDRYKSSIIPQAHHYASLSALAHITKSGALREKCFGITQFQMLSNHTNAHKLGKSFATILLKIFAKGADGLFVSAEDAHCDEVQEKLIELNHALVSSKTDDAFRLTASKLQSPDTVRSYIIPTGGNYVALALPSTPFSHTTIQHYAAERILAHILSTGPLWETIRMKGGAYGVGAQLASAQGAFCLFSYRDPNVSETITQFLRIMRGASLTYLTASTVEQAKISLCGKELRPFTPQEELGRIVTRTISNVTHLFNIAWYRALLQTNIDDVMRAADRLAKNLNERKISIIGGKKEIASAAKDFAGIDDEPLPLSL